MGKAELVVGGCASWIINKGGAGFFEIPSKSSSENITSTIRGVTRDFARALFDPNFKNCDLFHAQSPDTRRGVHARSWRANRDVDVRR